ncbi:unnamed protein product, partial [Rotaria sordida]
MTNHNDCGSYDLEAGGAST